MIAIKPLVLPELAAHVEILAVEILPNRLTPKSKFRVQVRCDSPKFSEDSRSFGVSSSFRPETFRINVHANSIITFNVVSCKSFLSKDQKIGVVHVPSNFVPSCVHDVAYDIQDEVNKEVAGRMKMKILVGPLTGSRTPEPSPRKTVKDRRRTKSENPTSRGWITSGSSSPSSANPSPRRNSIEPASATISASILSLTGDQKWDEHIEALKSQTDVTSTALRLSELVQSEPSSVPPPVASALQYSLPRAFHAEGEDESSVEDSDSFTGLSEIAITASKSSCDIIKALTALLDNDSGRHSLEGKFLEWLPTQVGTAWRLAALKDLIRLALLDKYSDQGNDRERTILVTELLKQVSHHSSNALDILHQSMMASSCKKFFFELGYVDTLTRLSKIKDNKRSFRQHVIRKIRDLATSGLIRIQVPNQDLLDMLLDLCGNPSSIPRTPSSSARGSRMSGASNGGSSHAPKLTIDIDLDVDTNTLASDGSQSDDDLSFSGGDN